MPPTVAGERVVELDVGVVGGELAQLADQRVEVAVGDLGVVELVVAVVVVGDELGQRDEPRGHVVASAPAPVRVGHRARLSHGDTGWRGLLVDAPTDLAGQSRTTRSATDGMCRPSPQCGVTRLRWRSIDRDRSRGAPARPQLA